MSDRLQLQNAFDIDDRRSMHAKEAYRIKPAGQIVQASNDLLLATDLGVARRIRWSTLLIGVDFHKAV
jgi:hypothetical protein